MPALSRRGMSMPASPIRKLVPFAEQAKQAGRTVYHLNIGQPDLETPRHVWQVLQQLPFKVLEYSHSAGFAPYKKKLAESYGRLYGIDISEDDLLITTGGSEAITFGLMAAVDSGQEVIVPEPLYANYIGFAVSAGISLRSITSTIDHQFALPSIDQFKELITPNTRAIIICNPNNPTGYLYSLQELEALREIVLRHDLFLFVDEVYRDFVYDGKKHYSILQVEGLQEHAVVIDSVSKRFSMCGARIGCLISRNRTLIESVLRFAQARLSPPSLGQWMAMAALDLPDEYYNQVREEYVQRRNYLVSRLNALPGVQCPLPGGTFYAMARLPIDNSDRFCQWLLESFAHNNATVMLAPASGFYVTPGLGHDEVRLAYVLNIDDLEKAMDCLAHGLEAYPGRVRD